MFNATQFSANVLTTAAGYLLVAASFAIIYRTVRFFHLTHAGVLTFGAYIAYICQAEFSSSPTWCFLLAASGSSLLGCFLFATIYRPLLRDKASPLVLLLASLGLYVVLQNLLSLAFGDGMLSISLQREIEPLRIANARISVPQVTILGAACLWLLLSSLLMRFTALGRSARAVASDTELALVCGVDVQRTQLCAFALGSGVVGLAGVLISLDTNMTPIMGMGPLMMGIVAMIVGGAGSMPGIATAALFLAFIQHGAVWTIGSRWQDATGLFVLLAFLLIRPYGMLGRREGELSRR